MNSCSQYVKWKKQVMPQSGGSVDWSIGAYVSLSHQCFSHSLPSLSKLIKHVLGWELKWKREKIIKYKKYWVGVQMDREGNEKNNNNVQPNVHCLSLSAGIKDILFV